MPQIFIEQLFIGGYKEFFSLSDKDLIDLIPSDCILDSTEDWFN